MSQTDALLAPLTADSTPGETSNREPKPRLGRSVGAVFAGLFTIFAVTTATDVVLHASGVFPGWDQRMSDGLFAFAAAYRVLYGILGSYVTAHLAPHRPMRHALALGTIGVIVSTAGAIAMCDLGPAWYSFAVIAMALPCAWAGAKLCARWPAGNPTGRSQDRLPAGNPTGRSQDRLPAGSPTGRSPDRRPR